MKRLAHIDWMRGLACVLMFQTHCYDSWLSPEARKSALFTWSQLGGTFPAPLFLFLAGISFALITERLREKNTPASQIAKTTILRGAEIFGLGLLFRIQEFVLGYRWSPWTDLLRVDVLNMLGISMMLMGVLCWATADRSPSDSGAGEAGRTARRVGSSRNRAILAALLTATVIALATPHVWTRYRPHWLPWPIESYINGVHIFDKPQPWLFPLFPWSAFAFVGLAVGFVLFTSFAKRREAMLFTLLGSAGFLACFAAVVFDAIKVRLYDVDIYDYWHTSPNFLLIRCGLLLIILFLVYAWCRWGLAQVGFSPIIQLGKTSLLVYWVHIEFVYGRFSILPKHQCSVLQASIGLLIIFLAMLVLSLFRTQWKNRHAKIQKQAALPTPAAL
jgi:uncharacterized membrane protein